MEQNSCELSFRHISKVTDESLAYINARRKGTSKSLKTRWSKFNRMCMGGIEPNVITTIAGGSGSGKSAFVNTLETDLIDLNPNQEIVILSFSFEMMSYRQIGRKISNKLRQTTSELYSAETKLDDSSYEKVKTVTEEIKNYPIYYVDTPGTVTQIEETIKKFYKDIVRDRWFVITLDHTLLVDGFDERKTLVELEKMLIRIKKYPMTSIIQIAQLNRNIEQPERINNPTAHYPMRSDLSASDAMYQASDYIAVIMRPELNNIQSYVPQHLPVRDKIYMHVIKNRDGGTVGILEFNNGLAYGDFLEPEQQQVEVQNNKQIKAEKQ